MLYKRGDRVKTHIGGGYPHFENESGLVYSDQVSESDLVNTVARDGILWSFYSKDIYIEKKEVQIDVDANKISIDALIKLRRDGGFTGQEIIEFNINDLI